MEIGNILDDIVQTKEEAGIFIDQLDQLVDEFYSKPDSFEQLCEKILPESKKTKILLFMKYQSIDLTSKSKVTETLGAIKQMIIQKPVLQLTIAFEAKLDTITMIRNWCRKELKILPLLDITYDKKLVAGCILQTSGYYKDYSVKKALEEKQEIILNTFNQYA